MENKEITFEKLWQALHDGYQVYYTYMEKKYLLYKVTNNCYREELLSFNDKSPHPRFTMVTLKKIKDIFPFMEEIEYKVIWKISREKL